MSTLLYVADESQYRSAYDQVLKQAGFTIWKGTNRTEALRLAEQCPDLILLVNSHGIDLCRILQTNPATAPIPVVLLSPDFKVACNRILGLQAGATDCLAHPVDPRELVLRVQALLRVGRLPEGLRQAEHFFRWTLDTLRTHVCVLDEQGSILAVNKAWRDFAQANPPVPDNCCEGASYLAACDAAANRGDRDARAFGEGLRAVLAGTRGEFAMECPCHSPLVQRWFMALVVPFIGGGTARVVIAHENITPLKEAEAERRKLEEQMQHAQKLESLGVLAGGLAHDFNNLLTGVLGNACLALRELPPGSRLHDAVADIQTAALRAADLTKQMLAYAGKGRLTVQAVQLSQVVQEMATLLQSVISKKAALHFDFADDLPQVEVDPTQLRQVVMNLITNASDSLVGESGRITLRTRVVVLDAAAAATFFPADLPPGKYVSLEVTDTGSGMDEATKKRIFDPFFTTKFTGRGLGLSAVLGIVRGHSGAIKITSRVGQGTTMRVLWPPLEKPVPEAPKQTASSSDWRGEGTILVVDDEATTRILAQKILEMVGFRVLQAEDGPGGVEVFLQHRREIVAVLLDLVMPKKSGDEVFRELRSHSPELPIVLISGFHERGVSELFQGTIPAVFVEKPFQPEALIDAVRQAMVP
jgi:signal transduction histidine kinase/DNA-binding response OmpR family regulator